MKKILFFTLMFMLMGSVSVLAESTYYVQPGDTLWKIAVRYQIGVTEIIEANPQLDDPDLIYPNDEIKIPNIDAIKHTEHIVIQLTNQERAANGLPELRPDWQLSRVARHKSADMLENNYFAHTSPSYGSPFDMLEDFGVSYQRAAENIARGQQTPHQVVREWMNSSGHRANILGDFTHIGVGYVEDGRYWTQMFIKR
ncbi:SafA/ExsA family spore coat assembly protein [Amphibacillus cookii]|uniref:SafA/ExsA family spore coat assembly protein n=1 Tax=Amphibacillus cookii TaxID=767787 RepID=UPI00195BCAD9|nr:SafA/ExsA family spore coat assembly protein [Amphibacillus cookii]MBM7542450.1 putative YkwD family protein/spore coat assembly protein SafA [Amphibacillus cookii]